MNPPLADRRRGPKQGPRRQVQLRPTGSNERWGLAVESFLRRKVQESSVGAAWICRMRWELIRVPRMQSDLGQPKVTRPCDLNPEHLRAVRARSDWGKPTIALHFAALRQFLRWAQNPVAQEARHWRLPAGQPSRRRWLSRDQVVQLYKGSRGTARLLVGLEALNGLRRVEVLRLRVQDVLLDEGCLRVLGKGRYGGKWRKIPVHPALVEQLGQAISGRGPDDRVLPLSRSGADMLLQHAALSSGLAAAGVQVSHHDLRRSFGRLAHLAGMDLVQLKNLYGHESMEMTVHYIGLDADQMRSGLERLSRSLGLAGRPAHVGEDPPHAPRPRTSLLPLTKEKLGR